MILSPLRIDPDWLELPRRRNWWSLIKAAIIVAGAGAAIWLVISKTSCSDAAPMYVGGILVSGCR